MFCRFCGNRVNHITDLCSKCGHHPLSGFIYCQNCGEETLPLEKKCSKCQHKLRKLSIYNDFSTLNFFDCLIAFFLPVIGFMIYLMYKDEYSSAKTIRETTKFGFYFNIMVGIILSLYYLLQ